ncbi:MAG: hypothetical protein JW888_03590 [Pirellulales bacterium]|nr:hypothetical protein [Pirellulales bacterium]
MTNIGKQSRTHCIIGSVPYWVTLCSTVVFFVAGSAASWAEGGDAAPAKDVLFGHFPDRAHAVVWRNWHAVEPERIATVLGTSVENVTAMAESMGLPPAIAIPPEQKTRGYFCMTLCRRNWHLLPMDQLATLLDTTPDELLRLLQVEEAANWHILGDRKPACPPVKYQVPDAQARQRAAQIKSVVEEYFGDALRQSGEPRFAFVHRLAEPEPSSSRSRPPATASDSPRIAHSFLKTFGDPLMDPKIDMYPEGLLQRLADQGINGIWLYGVLPRLAPGGSIFPEFGEGWETRQANLRKLVERAGKYGIGVYLYMNELRRQPPEFFASRPEMAGAKTPLGNRCICTSNPEVRKWMGDALANVFTNVPDLAGVFTITASETPTNCAWLGEKWKASCPRCKDRSCEEIIAEVNSTIEEGVHRGNPDARVMAWDWNWPGSVPAILDRLPKSVWLISVSEWSLPIERGGVKTAVNEYSMSAVGPGPRATAHWTLAKERGMKTVAKMQLGTTWEASSIPYLPVLDLVARHCHNVAAANVDGILASWTLGGYPSPNLRVAQLLAARPTPSVNEALDQVALEYFGPEGAAAGRRAWTAMSRAFEEYPYSQRLIYLGPMQLGPANLLYARRTGLRSTMVGFPFDDLRRWRGPYPPDVLVAQLEKVASGWAEGIKALEEAVAKTPTERKTQAEEQLLFARAARLYFASAANQAKFIMAREALARGKLSLAEKQHQREIVDRVVKDEIALAREMYALTKQNSCIGFEAASAYFYLPLDLVEKVVNCRYVLDKNTRGTAER